MDFQRLERVRIGVALVAAVVTGGAALYGVYTKARKETAASYETLAPEINQLKTAVGELQRENASLRAALGDRAAAPRAQPGGEGRAGVRRPRAPAGPDPAAPGPAPAPAPAPEDVEKQVPIDFDKAIQIWKDIQDLRRGHGK